MTGTLYLLVPLNLLLIGVYFYARWRDHKPLVRVVQPAAVIVSWLIAAASLLRLSPDPALTGVVLAGMAIAILGDFLNVDMTNMSVVLRGLIIAVSAYLTYAVGLTLLGGFQPPDLLVGALMLAIYAVLMRAIWRGVPPEMRLPVLIYGLVLPFTFSRALSAFFSPRFTPTTALLLSLGTGSLFVGDIEFALHTFRKPRPFMLGPLLYAGGQLLIALACWG